MERSYIAIDLKSFYASVECQERGLDPLTTNLVVADVSRTEKTICLAVSPALKAHGIPGRARLFEVIQKVNEVNRKRLQRAPGHRFSGKSSDAGELAANPALELDYIAAVPRMAMYMEYSTRIYQIYLKYVAPEDIHVYSIDEVFIDVTEYLHTYGMTPHELAITMIREVLKETGITATAGIGTNLYLAKVAMDIVAKKRPADKDGVRIAELNEDSYKFLLWDHKPLTDFWQIGPGKARRLALAHMFTMGEIAQKSVWDEEYFYKTFGIDGEILIDHAWGVEPVTMWDIKHYHSDAHSLSSGQVLPRPYKYDEARLVFSEMIEGLCADLFRKQLTSPVYTWWVSYDHKSLEACPEYDGPLVLDFYGRLHPGHANGTVRMREKTNSPGLVKAGLLDSFERKTDHRLLFRRLGVCAGHVSDDDGAVQLDLFTDYQALDKEKRIQAAMGEVRRRYGANAVFKGMNMLEGATALERNTQIGGHKA